MKYAFRHGWVSSKQPRESYTGKDNIKKWRGLVSIKRIEMKYFEDLGDRMEDEYDKAKQAAKEWLKMKARRWARPLKYIQTPITLLRRRRKEYAERSQATTTPIPI